MSSTNKDTQNKTTKNAVEATEGIAINVEEKDDIESVKAEIPAPKTENIPAAKQTNAKDLRVGIRVKIDPDATVDANGNELDKNLLLGSFIISNIAEGRVSLTRMLGVAAIIAVMEKDIIIE